MQNAAKNQMQQKAFADWQAAQAEADRVKRVWGRSNPHDAKHAQDKAAAAMQRWMAA